MKPDAKAISSSGLSFPEWAGALRADDSLSLGLRESYRRMLVNFLKFCQQRRAGATVALARGFGVDWWRIRTGRTTPQKLGLVMNEQPKD